MRTWKLALGMGVLAVVSACGTRAAVDAPRQRPALRMSMRVTDLLDAFLALREFDVEAVSSGDSEARLQALQKGSIDVSQTVADVTYLAYNGRLPDGSPPMQKLRGIALMNRALIHVLLGPTVKANHGFRGMRIVLGDPTGGNASLGERMVNSTGVASSEIQGEFAPYDVAVDKLLKGEVDASIVTGMLPEPQVVRAFRGGAHILEFDGPEVNALRMHYPLLRRTVIPAGTYPGQEQTLHTIGVDLMLVCRADLDSEVVYRLTRALFEEIPENLRRRIDPQRAPATIIPLHAGAARYYRERELRR